MAIVKGKKNDVVKDAPVKEKKAKKSKPEVVEEEVIEEEIVEAEVVSTNPDDFTYLVKLDAKKYPGRNTEQVDGLVFGAMGSVKKITIEKE